MNLSAQVDDGTVLLLRLPARPTNNCTNAESANHPVSSVPHTLDEIAAN